MTNWFGTLRLQTSNHTIYELLVDADHLFNHRYHLFAFGIVYGILHDKKDEKPKKNAFISISQISDLHIKELLNICYLILDDGSETKQIFNKMLAYADGGVIEINNIYKENKSFTLSNLIRDAEELWKKRVKNLHNINFKSN